MGEEDKNKLASQIASVLIDPKDKINQFTVITSFQAEIFPLLDVIIAGRDYILEVAEYNEDPKAYTKKMKKVNKDHPGVPVVPNLAKVLLIKIAEWQRSLGKDNFANKVSELALADIQSSRDEENDFNKYDFPNDEG